jgi:hypothetical protein
VSAEHFRPSARSRASLDGSWAFWPDLDESLPTGPVGPFVSRSDRERALGRPRTARVPAPWQAQFDDLRLWAGTGWYERDFVVPDTARATMHLGFGAVDYFATVWINGRVAGEHEGGYLPFRLDVTDVVRLDGPNTITVRALDVGPGHEAGPFPFSEIPHGKQSWYGPIGGIWQSVWLEARSQTFVDDVRISADPSTGDVSATVALGGSPTTGVIEWRILGPDGVAVATGALDPGDVTVRTRIRAARPWHPETPDLYALELEVREGDEIIDRLTERFGFRAVGVRDGRIVLNGQPVYLRGALDQDYWMPDIYTVGGDADLDREMRMAKELGLNLLRCHIKAPDPRYLAAADRAGVLVWCEPPNWIRLTDDAKRRARETFEGMVARDFNHPSLIIRSIVNEDWGTDLPGRPADRTWLRETYRWAKSLDPTRLLVDNSACPPNFHLQSDLNDYHVYRAVPEQLTSWRRWTAGWVSRPQITYSPHGDAVVQGSEPLVVSEFGIWGLPDPDRLRDADDEPWWFETGRDHSEGIVHPLGVRQRFDEWGLADVFGSFARFVRVSQQHEFEGLKLQIEDLRSHRRIAGYVITEFTDVHWEANGLLDMSRGPKAFHDRFIGVNAPDVVIVRPERNRYRSGERVIADVHAVGSEGVTDVALEWALDGFDAAGVASDGRIDLTAPGVERPTRAVLRARWVDDAGAEVNTGASPLWLYPEEPTPRAAAVAVTARWTEAERVLEAGGRVVIVASNAQALPPASRGRLEPFSTEDAESSRSIYGNGWVLSTGMGWLSPALTDGLAIGPALDLAFEGLTPRYLLSGYTPADRGDVLGGHHLGWLHRVRAIVAAFAHGSGVGVVCTLPVLDADGADPLATALLDRMADIVSGPAFSPRTRL